METLIPKPKDYAPEIDQAANLLTQSRFVVAFTGAGLSTRSGIPDFRSPGTGLWTRVDGNPESGTIQGFGKNPQAFYTWFRTFTRTILEAHPNAAHIALSLLEAMGYIRAVITQNADMLHQRAGSQHVLEVHGSLAEATCIQCYTTVDARQLLAHFVEDGQVPRCEHCGGVMKPNVILTNEQLPARVMLAAKQAVRECDLILTAGTSLTGGPATRLAEFALDQGAELVIVNLTPTIFDSAAQVVINADVSEVLPAIVETLRYLSMNKEKSHE